MDNRIQTWHSKTQLQYCYRYPAFVEPLKQRVNQQQKETFPFKSTASGNLKLTPNQVNQSCFIFVWRNILRHSFNINKQVIYFV